MNNMEEEFDKMSEKMDKIVNEAMKKSDVKVIVRSECSATADLVCYFILAAAVVLLLVYVSLVECTFRQRINDLDKRTAVLEAQIELLKPGEAK